MGERGDDPQTDVPQDLAAGVDVCDPLPDSRVVDAGASLLGGCARQLGQGERGVAPADELRDRGSFVEQRGLRDAPPVVDVAEAIRVGDARVGEEHLVEVRTARHLAEGTDLDPGSLHVDEEVGDARVLGGVGIGAGQEHPAAGVVRARRPDLLAVHDPLVTVAHGGRAQPREVRAGPRLGEQLAPDLLAGQQRGEPAGALLVGAVRDDGRSTHGGADAEHVIGDVERLRLVPPHHLLDEGRVAAPVRARPADGGPTVGRGATLVVAGAGEGLVAVDLHTQDARDAAARVRRPRGCVGTEPAAALRSERRGLGAVDEVHGGRLRSRSRGVPGGQAAARTGVAAGSARG